MDGPGSWQRSTLSHSEGAAVADLTGQSKTGSKEDGSIECICLLPSPCRCSFGSTHSNLNRASEISEMFKVWFYV